MKTNDQTSITDKNLNRLTEFLSGDIKQSVLAAQIPNGAHLFHGGYNDTNLTQANLKIATNILLGMTLGYVEEAPLVMIFEYKPGKKTLIDLSAKIYQRKAHTFIETFREQSRQELTTKINELVAV